MGQGRHKDEAEGEDGHSGEYNIPLRGPSAGSGEVFRNGISSLECHRRDGFKTRPYSQPSFPTRLPDHALGHSQGGCPHPAGPRRATNFRISSGLGPGRQPRHTDGEATDMNPSTTLSSKGANTRSIPGKPMGRGQLLLRFLFMIGGERRANGCGELTWKRQPLQGR